MWGWNFKKLGNALETGYGGINGITASATNCFESDEALPQPNRSPWRHGRNSSMVLATFLFGFARSRYDHRRKEINIITIRGENRPLIGGVAI